MAAGTSSASATYREKRNAIDQTYREECNAIDKAYHVKRTAILEELEELVDPSSNWVRDENNEDSQNEQLDGINQSLIDIIKELEELLHPSSNWVSPEPNELAIAARAQNLAERPKRTKKRSFGWFSRYCRLLKK